MTADQQFGQALQQLHVQKQRLQREKIELESAVEELTDASESYKIIGNVMIKKTPQDIKKGLEEQLEKLVTRIGVLEKQEKQLRENIQQRAQASE